MATQGAFTIVLNAQKDKVLLLRRKDFPFWDLPGGRVEEKESLENCAYRESVEETGYKIEIYRKIGEYQRPKIDDTQHIFLGRVIGGKEIIEGDETGKIKWFKFNRLPLFMVPHRRKQIQDFISGYSNIICTLVDSKLLLMLSKVRTRH